MSAVLFITNSTPDSPCKLKETLSRDNVVFLNATETLDVLELVTYNFHYTKSEFSTLPKND